MNIQCCIHFVIQHFLLSEINIQPVPRKNAKYQQIHLINRTKYVNRFAMRVEHNMRSNAGLHQQMLRSKPF